MQAALSANTPVPQLHRFVPPSLEEVRAYAKEKRLPEREAEKFFLYYESIGWSVGRARMKNWRSALSGWKMRYEDRAVQEVKRNEALTPSVHMMKLKQEMNVVEEKLRNLRQPVVNRWLQSKASVEAKMLPWREERDRLRALKADILNRMGIKA